MMSVTSGKVKTRADLDQSEDDFFANLVRTRSAEPFTDWERRANGLDGLLPGEAFHLRFVEKNFDGVLLNRWIVFCHKPSCSVHPGRERIITVMTIEKPGIAGSFSDPHESHLDGLRIVVLDWRQGRHAALARMKDLREKKEAANDKDALNEAGARADDAFWIWKRAMGESLNMCLGEEGTGPNYGSKYFGAPVSRVEEPKKTASGLYLP